MMFDWLKRKYVELCERIEAGTDKMKAERMALKAAREELEKTDQTIAKAEHALKDKK